MWPPPPPVGGEATALVTGDLQLGSSPGLGTSTVLATPGLYGAPPPTGTVKAVGGAPSVQGPVSGQPFGPRYHLVRLLGAGGMGAVYQAWDQELGVVVAIKVIRPEAMADPEAAREMERRFKRELLLARNVTHKNVVRIHDLGEVEGVKYITMPYVHGSDLASIVKREQKLPIPRALAIGKQIASGLVAAHDAGVVHRDLKPANILLDTEDTAWITDFGIARSTSGTAGGTVAGTVVGTLDYMAPEQARGQTVDHRADIYAFGLILSDMLIGRRNTGASGESSLAALVSRMTTAMPPIRSLDPNIPMALSDVVSRCTALEPEHRYVKTADLLADLEGLDSNGHPRDGSTRTVTHAWTAPASATPATAAPPITPPAPAKRTAPLFVAGVAVLVVGAGAYLFRNQFIGGAPSAPVATKPVSIVILPFRNASGDRSLDALGPTIAEQLRTEIGQTKSLTIRAGTQVAQILSDMRLAPESSLDPVTAAKIAGFMSSDVVISGQFTTFGPQVQITANLQDVTNQKTPVPIQETAADRSVVLKTIGQLAVAVRDKLTLAPDDLRALAASSYRPSASLEALQHYNGGVSLVREGKLLDAVKAFQAATQQDPKFALAYAKLGQTNAALGLAPEAEKHAQTADSLSAALPEIERFIIRATNARVLRNRAEAVESFEKLATLLPGSDEVLADLASAYEDNGTFDKANDTYKRITSRDPKNLDALIGFGRTSIKRGDPPGAVEPLNQAVQLAIQRDNTEAKAAALRWLGVTYRFLNKPDDARNSFQQALEIARKLGRRRLEAECIHGIGRLELGSGKFDLALKHYQDALNIRESIKDPEGVGDTLIDFGNLYYTRGEYDRALGAFERSLAIQRDQGNDTLAGRLLSNIGAIHYFRADNQKALTYYQQALAVIEKSNADPINAIQNLGETYVRLGRYRDAERDYLRALELVRKNNDRSGEARVSADMAVLYLYQGRLDAALAKAKEAYDAIERAQERTDWTILIHAGYGNALAAVGRFDDAGKILTQASGLAGQLKIDSGLATVLNYRGDLQLVQGDVTGARQSYDEALKVATRADDRFTIMWSRVNQALVALKDRPGAPAGAAIAKLATEADEAGLKYEAAGLTIALGEALLAQRQFAPARRELESARLASDRTGWPVQQARSRYWLSQALTGAGDASGAELHLREARRLLDGVRKEANGDAVLKRADLAVIGK